MKTLFISLVALLFAFFLGCQESSITDPVSNDTELNIGAVDKNIINYYPQSIVVRDKVLDPSHPNRGLTAISGLVRYNSEMYESLDPTGPRYRKGVNIRGYVDLTLDPDCPIHGGNMKVIAQFDQNLFFSNASEIILYFHEAFRVSKSCCKPLIVQIKFRVYDKKMEVASIRLIAEDN